MSQIVRVAIVFVFFVFIVTGALIEVRDQSVKAQSPAAPAPTLLQTSDARRLRYLARAVIWKPGGIPTPEQLREGPPGRYPLRGVALENGEIACTYDHGGAGSPGRTSKFTCRTRNGRSIRVKYYDGDPKAGNREVFAEVAATRLFWALGFDADPMYPVVVRCLDCPANPMTGVGARASRRYLGVVEAFYEGTAITSRTDPNQGWRFGEVLEAVATLSPGEERARQQLYFEALSLLGVFVQHGDRKPSQQRLVCRSSLDVAKGDVHPVDNEGFHLPVLFEHDGESACTETVLTIQDLGATFGSAGQFTMNVTAKMHLASWAGVPVFRMRSVDRRRPAEVPACYGNLTASSSAGAGADDRPRIGDAARTFLHDRLSALTPDHLRAIFETARVPDLQERHVWRDPASGTTLEGVDAWIGAFQNKVTQIGAERCPE